MTDYGIYRRRMNKHIAVLTGFETQLARQWLTIGTIIILANFEN